MILFQNTLIKLDYEPSTDILTVAYPDLHTYLLPEINNSIDILISTVSNYDIKKVLLDSSKTSVAVAPEESQKISHHLADGFSKTRVQKVARLQSATHEVENLAQGNISEITREALLPFQIESFSDLNAAMSWLNS